MKRPWLAAAALVLGAAPAVQAHPHGSMECRAEVRMERGALATVRGVLLLDAAQSAQALALVRDPGGGLDPARAQRLAFALQLQVARWNWLFALEADGAPAVLVGSAPRLEVVDERLQVTVDLQPAAPPQEARRWSLRCVDPTYYWSAAFAPSGPAAVRVEGCETAASQPVSAAPPDHYAWECRH